MSAQREEGYHGVPKWGAGYGAILSTEGGQSKSRSSRARPNNAGALKSSRERLDQMGLRLSTVGVIAIKRLELGAIPLPPPPA